MKTKKIASIKLTCFKSDVYEPSDDSFLLADTLLSLAETWSNGWPRVALEVGSGSGYIICSLALALNNQHIRGNRLLLATDLNPSAAIATHETLAAHGMKTSADVIITDLAAVLQPRLHGAVDLLVFNPPYVPTPDEEVQRGGIAAAWAGGYRGRRVLDRLLPSIPLLLSDRGQAFVIALPDNDPQEVLNLMADVGLQGKVVAQRSADEERLLVLQFWREMNE